MLAAMSEDSLALDARAAGYVLQPLPQVNASEVLQHYEELTFPPLARRLALARASGRWRGALALSSSGPVGLALVEISAQGPAQLFSLAVLPAHRRRGVATALVDLVERLAREAGASALEGAYRTSWRTRHAIEALLAARGWSSPETRMVLARGDTAFARHLLRRPPPALPEGAELFGWEELTGAERDDLLARQETDPWYPEILTPFQEQPRLEPAISVGLRLFGGDGPERESTSSAGRGEIVGWLMCHRVTFDTLQYSAFFVREDLRGRGLGWALLREAVRRRLADPDIRFTILAVDARNQRMLALLEQHLRPYLVGTSELRVSSKPLSSRAAGSTDAM